MRDLLERILGYLPAYLKNLPDLVQGPKRFVLERLSRKEHQQEDALVFLAISFLIGWILKASFIRQGFYIELAADSAFVLALVFAYGVALCLAWRIVKGRAEVQQFFVIHFYYSGVLLLIASCWFMTIVGTLRAFNANLYTRMLENIYQGNAATFFKANAESITAAPGLMPVILGGQLGVLTWIFVGWGAYRQLNHASKFRSGLAAMLFAFFWFPIAAFGFLLANAAVK